MGFSVPQFPGGCPGVCLQRGAAEKEAMGLRHLHLTLCDHSTISDEAAIPDSLHNDRISYFYLACGGRSIPENGSDYSNCVYICAGRDDSTICTPFQHGNVLNLAALAA